MPEESPNLSASSSEEISAQKLLKMPKPQSETTYTNNSVRGINYNYVNQHKYKIKFTGEELLYILSLVGQEDTEDDELDKLGKAINDKIKSRLAS